MSTTGTLNSKAKDHAADALHRLSYDATADKGRRQSPCRGGASWRYAFRARYETDEGDRLPLPCSGNLHGLGWENTEF